MFTKDYNCVSRIPIFSIVDPLSKIFTPHPTPPSGHTSGHTSFKDQEHPQTHTNPLNTGTVGKRWRSNKQLSPELVLVKETATSYRLSETILGHSHILS